MLFTTITLNPAVDRTEYLTGIHRGGVNRPYQTRLSAGGKGINLSRALHALSANVNTVSFAGGKTGALLGKLLEREGLPARLLPSDFETRCAIKLVTGSETTEINEEGRLSSREIETLLLEIGELAAMSEIPQTVFLCGSFPQGVDKNVYNFLITLLEGCGITTVVDTSGEGLVESLKASPSLIKPNENELAYLHGGRFSGESELVEFCRELYVDNGSEVLCTLGEKGSVFVGKEGVFRRVSQKISPCDPTGAGDRFLAAFAYAYYEKKTGAEKALAFADEFVRKSLLSRPATGNESP